MATIVIGDIKIEDLYKKSFPRNHLLFGLLQRMDLVEEIGSGLMRMDKMMEKYLLSTPTIEANDHWFSIAFTRPDLQKMSIEQRIEEYQRRVREKVSENQLKILGAIKENKFVTVIELKNKIGISEKSINSNLKKLKEKRSIKRIGPAKGGYWEIIENY